MHDQSKENGNDLSDGADRRSTQSTANGGGFPKVRPATIDDIKFVLSRGFADFRRAPQFGLFFGGVYALGGLILTYTSIVLGITWVAYPLVIGFALVGPFVATGLYEVSRLLERGEALRWNTILSIVWRQHRRELGWMAFVMLFVFWVWMYQARTLVAVFFGFGGFATMEGFLTAVFTTSNGLTFLAVGHAVGAVLSLVLFTLTVVSIPLLLDRELDFVTAMVTSVRAVLASPVIMVFWGWFVSVCVIVSAIPFFAGLLITLPVLGHATWHLYKRIVEPQEAG